MQQSLTFSLCQRIIWTSFLLIHLWLYVCDVCLHSCGWRISIIGIVDVKLYFTVLYVLSTIKKTLPFATFVIFIYLYVSVFELLSNLCLYVWNVCLHSYSCCISVIETEFMKLWLITFMYHQLQKSFSLSSLSYIFVYLFRFQINCVCMSVMLT